jgi:hypothetical protein
MGRNLTNLYISQSFQFLTQISGSELQTGLGDTITGSLLITASKADTATTAVSASYSNVATSASYALVSTSSSFATNATNAVNATTATSASYALTASFALNAGGGGSTNTGSLLVTASAVSNIITFTKGDGSTFPVTVATGSTVSSSFASTASLALLNVLTASNTNATITYTKGDGTTFTNVINNVVNANSASVATSASYAVSASQAQNAVTASFALNVTPINTGSFVTTASISNATTTFTKGDGSTFALTANNVVNADSASVAISASQAVSASFASTIANGLSPTFANVTASNVLITGTASVALLYTQTISSSVIYSSGSNQFGDAANDVQTLYGTFNIVNGPTNFTGSVNSLNGYTGSLLGTASFATSASQAQNAVSASFATTASFYGGSVVSASYAVSASQAQNSVSSSYALSSSFATTASFALNAPASNPFPFTGSAIISGSLIVTGSLSVTGSTGVTVPYGTVVTNPSGRVLLISQHAAGPIDSSVAIGQNTLANANGNNNTAVGSYALQGVTGGGGNVGIGASSGFYIEGGTNNIAIGRDSGFQQGSRNSSDNVHIGYLSGFGTVGGNNVAIGTDTNYPFDLLSTGANTFVGKGAGKSFSNGGSSVGIGYFALQGSNGNNNTALGLQAGLNSVGSNNVFLGYTAGQGLTVSDTLIIHNNYTTEPLVKGNFSSRTFTISGSTTLNGNTTISGSLNFISGSFSGSAITNITDTYTTSPRVNQVVTLTQAEYNAIGSPDANTLYVISGSIPFNSSAFATTGSNTFTGNQIVTGSVTATAGFTGSLFGTASSAVFATGAGAANSATSASYALIATSASFATSASLAATASFYSLANVTQNAVFSGSVRGEVQALSISSQTASLDCATDNFFTLTLVSGSNTFVNPSNILPGQTINLRIKQASVASGSISFASSVKQVSGSLYTPTATANGEDIVTFISFDSTNLYLSNIKNFV